MNKSFTRLANKSNMIFSLAAVIISGLIFASTLLLQAYSRQATLDLSRIRTLYLGVAIFSIVSWAVLSFLSYFLALLLLHTSKPSMEIASFLKVSGYAFVPLAFWNVEWIGWLIALIGIFVWIMASKYGFETDLERAVIISLPIIVAYLFVLMFPTSPFPFGSGMD